MTKYYLYIKTNENESNTDCAIGQYPTIERLKKEKEFFERLGYYCEIKIFGGDKQ